MKTFRKRAERAERVYVEEDFGRRLVTAVAGVVGLFAYRAFSD